MATRKQLWHPDEVRQKIQTSQLINRLNSHAIGDVELSPTQVKAIEILLRKTMPDLSSVDSTVSGQVNTYVLSDKPMSNDEWETAYGVAAADRPAKSAH